MLFREFTDFKVIVETVSLGMGDERTHWTVTLMKNQATW